MKAKTAFVSFSPLHSILAAGVMLSAVASLSHAEEVFSSDFNAASLEAAGWTPKGAWTILDFETKKPGLPNNPGKVAVFPAKGGTAGMLTRKFEEIKNPSSLVLTFDGGYGWGKKDHAQKLQVMLLDDEGNGYIFDTRRSNAKWGVNWGVVTKYGYTEPLNMAETVIDATQDAVVNGGGLRTFTIKRDASGKWTFNGDGWKGGPVEFTDATTSAFSQVVFVGTPNSDDLAYGKTKLEVTK